MSIKYKQENYNVHDFKKKKTKLLFPKIIPDTIQLFSNTRKEQFFRVESSELFNSYKPNRKLFLDIKQKHNDDVFTYNNEIIDNLKFNKNKENNNSYIDYNDKMKAIKHISLYIEKNHNKNENTISKKNNCNELLNSYYEKKSYSKDKYFLNNSNKLTSLNCNSRKDIVNHNNKNKNISIKYIGKSIFNNKLKNSVLQSRNNKKNIKLNNDLIKPNKESVDIKKKAKNSLVLSNVLNYKAKIKNILLDEHEKLCKNNNNFKRTSDYNVKNNSMCLNENNNIYKNYIFVKLNTCSNNKNNINVINNKCNNISDLNLKILDKKKSNSVDNKFLLCNRKSYNSLSYLNIQKNKQFNKDLEKYIYK